MLDTSRRPPLIMVIKNKSLATAYWAKGGKTYPYAIYHIHIYALFAEKDVKYADYIRNRMFYPLSTHYHSPFQLRLFKSFEHE